MTTRPAAPGRLPAARPAHTADPAWVRALFLAPAVVGSVAALLVLGRSRRSARRPGADADLDALRQSILGQTRRRLTARFGPPPAATSAPTVTWYYAVPDATDRTAMAVTFDGDAAASVEFVRSPA